MPTYQYECSACGHSFEHLQSMLDKKLRKCPECGKFKLQRLIGTGAGVIFKGSGFYATDYKKPAAAAEKTDHSCGSSCGCGAPAKSDSDGSAKKDKKSGS